MYEDYASAHAKALEGARTARVRAMQEMRRPPRDYEEGCLFHPVPATALWVHPDTGRISSYCAEHLQTKLAEYASDPESYPPVIVPLKRTVR